MTEYTPKDRIYHLAELTQWGASTGDNNPIHEELGLVQGLFFLTEAMGVASTYLRGRQQIDTYLGVPVFVEEPLQLAPTEQAGGPLELRVVKGGKNVLSFKDHISRVTSLEGAASGVEGKKIQLKLDPGRVNAFQQLTGLPDEGNLVHLLYALANGPEALWGVCGEERDRLLQGELPMFTHMSFYLEGNPVKEAPLDYEAQISTGDKGETKILRVQLTCSQEGNLIYSASHEAKIMAADRFRRLMRRLANREAAA